MTPTGALGNEQKQITSSQWQFALGVAATASGSAWKEHTALQPASVLNPDATCSIQEHNANTRNETDCHLIKHTGKKSSMLHSLPGTHLGQSGTSSNEAFMNATLWACLAENCVQPPWHSVMTCRVVNPLSGRSTQLCAQETAQIKHAHREQHPTQVTGDRARLAGHSLTSQRTVGTPPPAFQAEVPFCPACPTSPPELQLLRLASRRLGNT